MGELEVFEVKDIAEDDEKLKEFFKEKVSNRVFLWLKYVLELTECRHTVRPVK